MSRLDLGHQRLEQFPVPGTHALGKCRSMLNSSDQRLQVRFAKGAVFGQRPSLEVVPDCFSNTYRRSGDGSMLITSVYLFAFETHRTYPLRVLLKHRRPRKLLRHVLGTERS